MTLRLRIFLWYGGVAFVTGGLLVLIVYLVVAHKLEVEYYQFLSDEYREALRVVGENMNDKERLEKLLAQEATGARYFPSVYRLYDLKEQKDLAFAAARGDVQLQGTPFPRMTRDVPARMTLARSKGEPGFSIPLPEAIGNASRDEEADAEEDERDEDEIYYLTGFPSPEEHPDVVLMVGMSYNRVQLRVDSLRHFLTGAFVLMFAIASVGGSLLASRSLKPVKDMADSLERVGANDLSYRLPASDTRDEVGRIAASVNNMLGRLEQAFEGIRGFTADAAHELRTPLAAARCRLEVALERERSPEEYRQAAADALEQLAGLNKLIDNMLLLTNLDAHPDSYERQDVDLKGLLAEIAELFQIVAEEAKVTLALECPPGCHVAGSSTLLRRLFSNLIENALRHTPAGGRVRVSVSPSGRGYNITVSDTGEGMRPEELTRVFERFYRTDASRSRKQGGFGLGLAIVRKIVEVHDGLIRAESVPGKGTTFSVYLPA